jgi:hypothetical protein
MLHYRWCFARQDQKVHEELRAVLCVCAVGMRLRAQRASIPTAHTQVYRLGSKSTSATLSNHLAGLENAPKTKKTQLKLNFYLWISNALRFSFVNLLRQL